MAMFNVRNWDRTDWIVVALFVIGIVCCVLFPDPLINEARANPDTTVTSYPSIVAVSATAETIRLNYDRSWSLSVYSGETVYVTFGTSNSGITLDTSAEDNKLIIDASTVAVIGPGVGPITVATASGTSVLQLVPSQPWLGSH